MAGSISDKIWSDFFDTEISNFWSVLEILAVICDFFLPNVAKIYEDSDSEHESFQKVCGESFELDSDLTHEEENSRIYWKIKILLKLRE